MTTYEELRDATPGAAGHDWQEADRLAAKLRQTYASLEEATTRTEDYKAQAAWAAFADAKDRIETARSRARKLLAESARSALERSIPLPEGASRQPADASELLASQNEAARIRQQIERRSSGPLGAKPADVLREEYTRALETGGVEGAAIARAVVAVARERGADVEGIVAEHRSDYQRKQRERAELDNFRARHVGGPAVPAPPFDPPPGVSVPPGVKPRRKARGKKGRPAWLG